MIRRLLAGFDTLLTVLTLAAPLTAYAQTTAAPAPAGSGTSASTGSGEFSLQVTPSPLVTTLKPGTPSELELKIRNAGTTTEELKIEARSFKLGNDTGQVDLDDTTPPDISPFLSFSNPNFNIPAKQWFTQKVRISLPKEAGCSYSFALVISRRAAPKATEGGRVIKGSLAVFTLVNTDRPDCKRQLEVASFTTSKGVYEYLPADLTIKFKNTGNSIVQPYGNVYLQRGADDTAPITTLPVNDNRAHILPGSTRSLKASWTSGFPVYRDGKLVWDWAKIADLRIGKYTAKLVAVYNDGGRDVPVVQTVSFWVIPWKILAGLALVVLLVLFAVGMIIWQIIKLVRRGRARRRRGSNDTDSGGSAPTSGA